MEAGPSWTEALEVDINRLLTWVLCMGLHLQLWLQAVWLYMSTSLRFAP